MSIAAGDLPGAIATGIGATLFTDLWNLFLKRAFSVASLNYCLLGRWLLHLPGGTLRHASISAAAQKPGEWMVGGMAHYGISTVVFPCFILQPSLGFGIAASKTPKPAQARLKSLVTHTVFGVGLYVSALGVNYALRCPT